MSDNYGKPGLVPIAHRLEMLRASIGEKHWIRVDPWEAEQKDWTRTRIVLGYHHEEAKKKYGESTGIRYLAGNFSHVLNFVRLFSFAQVPMSFARC